MCPEPESQLGLGFGWDAPWIKSFRWMSGGGLQFSLRVFPVPILGRPKQVSTCCRVRPVGRRQRIPSAILVSWLIPEVILLGGSACCTDGLVAQLVRAHA